MRILHLLDLRFAPWSVLAGITGAIHQHRDAHHTVCLLGGVTDAQRARFAGVGVDLRIAPPLASPWACRAVLQRTLDAHEPFDIVHAWSAQSCELAREVCRSSGIVATVFESPASMPLRSARRALGALRAAGALRFGDAYTRGSWLDQSATPDGEVLVGPPTIPDWGDAPSRLRSALEIEAGTGVLVAVSEPGETIDAMLCMYIVGVLSERGLRATVLVPSDATGLDRAERFSVYHLGKWTVRVCDRPLWEQLSIADGVVVADRAPCDGVRRSQTVITGAQWGGQLGLPIIAPREEQYERSLPGDVRWVEAGDRLGFVRAAHDVLSLRSDRDDSPRQPMDTPNGESLYRLCGLANT